MFRSAKPRSAAPSEPKIWSEGQQFAAFDIFAWARVSAILARRAASGTLGRTSVACANLAFDLEEGRWVVNFPGIGRAAALIPSRRAVARGLARLSRVQAMAAEVIDHQSVDITPLEFNDLSAFMQSRRLATNATGVAHHARAARPIRPARPVRKIGPAAAAQEVPVPTPTAPSGLIVAPAPAPSAVEIVSSDELMAIRMAIASAPEPAVPVHYPGAFAPDPVEKPVARSDFSGAQAIRYAEHLPPEPPLPIAAPAKRAQNPVLRLLAFLGRGAVSLLGTGLLAVWRPVKAAVAVGFATALGWTGVALALPYGALQATLLHARHVDLREFD